MKISGLFAAALAAVNLFAAAPVATSVAARQRYPWNGKVDVVVTLSGDSNDVARADCVFAATNKATGAALAMAHVTDAGTISGSGATWMRRYVWDAAADLGEVKIEAITLSAEITLGGVQLWENGPYWDERNVGATKPEESGYYFWWGDTVGYTCEGGTYDDSSYPAGYKGVTWFSSSGTRMDGSPFDGDACPTVGNSVSELKTLGYIDETGSLVAAHDAATAHLGAPWRMPTVAEMSALEKNCTTTWTTRNGVFGCLVTGKGLFSTKSIFLPAAGVGDGDILVFPDSCGFYWSPTPASDNSDNAVRLRFSSGDFGLYHYPRRHGRSVRPVRGLGQGGAQGTAGVTAELALDTRTGTRYARAEEPLAFDTAWGGNVTRLVLNVDGTNVLAATTATNGVYVWRPDFSSARDVALRLTLRGAVNEVLTTTFMTAAYDVAFDAGAHGAFAGGGVAAQRVPHGEAAVAPAVVPAAGYRFTGWSADVSAVTGNLTAVAQYEAIPYAITYENLCGAAHANPSSYTVADSVTFAAPGRVPRQRFVHWEPASIPAGSTGAVTVRAVWEVTPYVYVDAVQGDDVRDGYSADQAVRTLARAYELAEPGDVVIVAAGTYGPVAATGKAVTFRAADGAVIDGGGTRRCVTADTDVVFENFTIQHGYNADAGGGVRGGTFEACTIRDCVSEWDGGGAYEAVLIDCRITGNTAEYGWGGGAYGGTLVGCIVEGNTAGDEGGGLYAPASVTDTTVRGNVPDDVAGVADPVVAGGSFAFTPAAGAEPVSVPHDWFVAAGLARYGDPASGLAAQLAAPYAPGYTGWEAFVAGLTARDQAFRAEVGLKDGEVRVSWTPDLNTGSVTRIYTVYGRTDLATGDWESVRPWHRFFKVAVALPTGADGEETAVSGEGFAPEEKPLGGVQLWEGGPYWAECNVGATKPEEYGYYFWWGDTVGYTRSGGTWDRPWYNGVTWVSSAGTRMESSPFTWDACPMMEKSVSQLEALGYIDATGTLVAKYDAATAHLGAPWRMPTAQELNDLMNDCDWTWTTRNGVYGQLVTGRGAFSTKGIFLPAAGIGYESYLDSPGSDGHYWFSSPFSDDSNEAWHLDFYSGNFYRSLCYRYGGQSVRPVRGFAK